MAKIWTGLAILGGLLASLPASLPMGALAASPDVAIWFRVNIPTEGLSGKWVLADGSDIQRLTLASDGTLYCYANPTGTSYTLFKSTDGGISWSYTGNVKDAIVDIATGPDNAKYVYYATTAAVYRSNDAGNTFATLPPGPAGASSNNTEITSIAVAPAISGGRTVAVATRDTDAAQFGGVYTINDDLPIAWTDTGLRGYDVYAVAFSPAYIADRELVAVVTDETDTLVTSMIGGSAWGATVADARLNRDNSAVPKPVAVARAAAIAFPDDYETLTERLQFVAIDTGSGQGDVYRIDRVRSPGTSRATDLNIGSAYGSGNTDATTVAVSGNAAAASVLAGVAGSAQVYFSADAGKNWTRSTKEPTGQTRTSVVMAPKFSAQGRAYAATSGSESAFSATLDKGATWNQLSLIDTRISSIIDLAPSPNYSQDTSLFLLTFRTGGKHSLWRSVSGSAQWERVYSGALAGVTALDRIELSPQYGGSGRVVFIAGNGATPAVWVSTDNGQTFGRRPVTNPLTGSPVAIDTWAVTDNNTLFIGSYDGTSGVVYRTSSAGFWYSTGTAVGSVPLQSIVLSPDYAQDKTLLVGNTNGAVFWSSDDGKSFQPLPPDGALPPLTGDISVAFDARYGSNKTVYAASDQPDKSIYRYIMGKGAPWEKIDGTLPAGGTVGQLAMSPDGTLYAANFKANGGLERSLKPTYPLGPSFETVTRGLDNGATLTGLWTQGNTLWSIDTTNNRVMSYIDSLTQPPSSTSPLDKTSGMGTLVNYTVPNIILEWEPLRGATRYQWQLDYDGNFSSIPAGFDGKTEAASARLPALDPGTKCFWRVRANQPTISPWSPTRTFTTAVGSETTAPAAVSPAGGAAAVDVKPVFQWSAVPWGHRYELLVATDPSFANPIIVKTGDYTLPATAWQCDIGLSYSTTYYWKTRATSSANFSPWSAVSAFTTRPAPAPTPAAAAPPAPAPSPTPMAFSTPAPSPTPAPPAPAPAPAATPEWIPLVIGALTLVVVIQLVVILALVVTIRRM